MAFFRFAEFFPGDKMKRMAKELKSGQGMMEAVGALMVQRTQAGFRNQRRGTFKWAPRGVKTEKGRIDIAGLLTDLAKGPSVKSRRLSPSGRPALIGIRRMFHSITWRVVGKLTIEFGTNVPYAKRHQTGGPSKAIPITSTTKRNLAKFLRSGRGRKFRDDLSWIFGKSSHTPNVRKRPFVVVTDEDRREIKAIVSKAFSAA